MGKSTLLNQLLQKLSGGVQKGSFTTASTHKPCTKGLWIWSRPIERPLPDGKKMHLVDACHVLSDCMRRMTARAPVHDLSWEDDLS